MKVPSTQADAALARKRRLPVREDVIVLAPSAEVAEQAQVWLMQLVRGAPVEAS